MRFIEMRVIPFPDFRKSTVTYIPYANCIQFHFLPSKFEHDIVLEIAFVAYNIYRSEYVKAINHAFYKAYRQREGILLGYIIQMGHQKS